MQVQIDKLLSLEDCYNACDYYDPKIDYGEVLISLMYYNQQKKKQVVIKN